MSLDEIAPYLVTKYVEDNSHYDFNGDYIPEYMAFWTSPKQMKKVFYRRILENYIV